ncbi:MAG: heterodisulfide reductase-related iron-sulfur binding cluster [Armatimonadota bacterium]|nr:heterodisulfide reductase-related iron-sulfur binding cluster [Armatimonadota bacterium]
MNKDTHEQDLMACVHCGLCLPACPTYLETGSEADSPRGRIVLMRKMHEGSLSPQDADVTRHLDLCLGCRACETACPSAVPYGRILETARERINAERVRPRSTDWSRKALLDTLTEPKKMTVAMRMAQAMTGGVVPAPAVRLLSGDPNAAAQRASLPETISPPLPPVVTPAVGTKRARVGVLAGCAMRVLFGDVNADTVKILAANGCEVLVNRRQGCCGALHGHNGYGEEARSLARGLIDAFSPFDGLDTIVVNSAGCGSMMKEYGSLLADDSDYAAKAAAFAAKAKDVCEWLDELGWIAPLRAVAEMPVTMTYHDACHLAHGQQIRDAPRALLARLPNVAWVHLPESEVCCGSAGIYNFTEPDMARNLQRRKLENILTTGASVVATGNPGCLSWIGTGLKERGLPQIRVVHPVTLLAEALRT